MIQIALLSVPLAVLWMILTGQENIAGFVLGLIISVGILVLIKGERAQVKPSRIPVQLFALLVYILRLTVDIFLSSVDVARRVLDPRMPIDPAIIRVRTQDPDNNPLVSALSAHAITITPGEMVIDFDEREDETIMYVHALTADKSRQTLEEEQTKRLKLIRRILGYN